MQFVGLPLGLRERYAAVRVGRRREIGRELKQSCQANRLATLDMALAPLELLEEKDSGKSVKADFKNWGITCLIYIILLPNLGTQLS